jgi:alkanesulfonate monooxygenase SsuD/methylene tetrahydromethanopterin reductase-like flavin-dependent oxidoreductase (luciferase family)
MNCIGDIAHGWWAPPRDKAARVSTRPDNGDRITHAGPYDQSDTIFLSKLSRQRTPVLFQASALGRGKDFAARHAECIFVLGSRTQARGIGNATSAQAQARFEESRRYASSEAGLAHFSAQTGIDFSRFDLDTPLTNPDTQALKSFLESVTTYRGGQVWAPRKLLESMVLGSRHQPIVGSAAEVSDLLERWMDDAGIDGFDLVRTAVPECFTALVDLLLPELQAHTAASHGRPIGIRPPRPWRPRWRTRHDRAHRLNPVRAHARAGRTRTRAT